MRRCKMYVCTLNLDAIDYGNKQLCALIFSATAHICVLVLLGALKCVLVLWKAIKCVLVCVGGINGITW